MALSLGVHTGSTLKIGSTKVEVLSIGPGESMRLSVEGSQKFNVTSQSRVEIMPKVYVSVGRGLNKNPGHRLCFEADRSIPISRLS
jgi:hypothetical protein